MEIGKYSGWANERMDKIEEILSELKFVLSGKGSRWFDSLLPLILFLVIIPIGGSEIALMVGIGTAIIFLILRLIRKDSIVYSLGGLGSVLLTWIFVRLSGTEAGFVLPGLITGAITIVLCVISVVINRPLVAWTSYIARRWPLNWYWHPRVLPAYNEVTIGWAVFFTLRLVLKYWFYQQGSVEILSWLEILLGWPFTIVLLIGSYIYGRWRLNQIDGPSIDEFKSGKESPWEGQKKGF